MNKTCTQCNIEKAKSDFYGRLTKCKECFKAQMNAKYVKVPKGFAKLPEETRNSISNAYKDRKNKMKDIAAANGICYATLLYWVKNGQIV